MKGQMSNSSLLIVEDHPDRKKVASVLKETFDLEM
jgi:hypothetical protein